jgi:hypothetical protein
MESGLRGEGEVHPLSRLRDDPYARGAGTTIPGLKTQPETRERQPIIGRCHSQGPFGKATGSVANTRGNPRVGNRKYPWLEHQVKLEP